MNHLERIDALRAQMETHRADAVLLSVGSDLPYFSGYRAMPLERITMLVVDASEATLFVPELEAPRVAPTAGVTIKPWSEQEDPLDLIAASLRAAKSLAVADQTWAGFLLGLQERIPAARWRSADPLTRQLRMRKSEAELTALRQAGAAADRVAARIPDEEFVGRSEREMSRRISDMLIAEGHQSVEFAIVASGPNGASPHHEAGDRTMRAGDPIVMDFGGSLDGYASDTTRTFHVGEPTDEFAEMYEVLYSAQMAAVEAVRPGVTAQEIDRVARGRIASAGHGRYFIHRTGHGIGLDTHEHPYLIEGNDLVLEPGMTFSVEPGIYLPGRFGMRIEDIVAVTEDGVESLNRSTRRLVIV